MKVVICNFKLNFNLKCLSNESTRKIISDLFYESLIIKIPNKKILWFINGKSIMQHPINSKSSNFNRILFVILDMITTEKIKSFFGSPYNTYSVFGKPCFSWYSARGPRTFCTKHRNFWFIPEPFMAAQVPICLGADGWQLVIS